MQWIIDIIKEQLKLKVGFFHRPCPVNPDWGIPELANSTGWRFLDCSSIVPAGTRAVLLRCYGLTSAAGRRLQFRSHGENVFHNFAVIRTQRANTTIDMDKIVFLDDDLRFESKVSSTVWTELYVTVQGYWLTGIIQNSFFNRGDPTSRDFETGDFIHDSSFHELDMSAVLPPDTTLVLMRCRLKSFLGGAVAMFRTHGNIYTSNASQCTAVMSGKETAYDIQVPTNGLQSIDYVSGLASPRELYLYVKGWWY